MDITRNQKVKRREPDSGLRKRSQGNTTSNTKKDNVDDYSIIIDGKKYEMAEDLRDLPEIDYNDPDVKKWWKEEEGEFRRRHPNLTHEEAMKIAEENLKKIRKKLNLNNV